MISDVLKMSIMGALVYPCFTGKLLSAFSHRFYHYTDYHYHQYQLKHVMV